MLAYFHIIISANKFQLNRYYQINWYEFIYKCTLSIFTDLYAVFERGKCWSLRRDRLEYLHFFLKRNSWIFIQKRRYKSSKNEKTRKIKRILWCRVDTVDTINYRQNHFDYGEFFDDSPAVLLNYRWYSRFFVGKTAKTTGNVIEPLVCWWNVGARLHEKLGNYTHIVRKVLTISSRCHRGKLRIKHGTRFWS